MNAPALEPRQAEQLASVLLGNLHRPYPYYCGYVLESDADARPPRTQTPIFYGCFDWHSAVHSHWSCVRLLAVTDLDASWIGDVTEALARSFDPELAAREAEFVTAQGGFELPYGLSWLLTLIGELRSRAGAAPQYPFESWANYLEPLRAAARERLCWWLDHLDRPIRTGEHSQSAFSMGLIFDYALAVGDDQLADRVRRRAIALYSGDRDAPVAYEPSAYDFLSPVLAEADLMRRVWEPARFNEWLRTFLPSPGFVPVMPLDRSDGKLCHLDGLNLSRSWMMRGIASATSEESSRSAYLRQATEHLEAGVKGLSSTHYAGTHWLPTFGLYALTGPLAPQTS